MKRIFLLVCSLLLVLSIFGSAGATTIFQSSNLAGDVSITGFNDYHFLSPGAAVPGDGIFTAAFTNLDGDGSFQTLLSGMYDVFVQGSVSFLGYGTDRNSTNPGYIEQTITNPQLVYSGNLGSTGLTQSSYPFQLGTAFGSNVPFDFTIDYGVDAAWLQAFGVGNFDAAGSLHVNGSTDGMTANVTFTESNLTWLGFEGALAAVDSMGGGGNGTIDGPFTLGLTITALPTPEPSTILLVGFGILGFAGVGRRKKYEY